MTTNQYTATVTDLRNGQTVANLTGKTIAGVVRSAKSKVTVRAAIVHDFVSMDVALEADGVTTVDWIDNYDMSTVYQLTVKAA